MKILVSVGTHEQPFSRMIRHVERLILEFPQVTWTVQYGVAQWNEIRGVEAARYFDHLTMQRKLTEADLLISQASPGNLFAAIACRAWPIVVGRRAQFREHVDDHQTVFAKEVNRLGLGTGLDSELELGAAISAEFQRTAADRIESLAKIQRSSEDRTKLFRESFWAGLGY